MNSPAGERQGEDPGALLTEHAFLVLVGAGLIALVVGGLTYLSTGNTAGAVLASMTAGGVSAPVLHKIVGP
ncbi:hypothetical protein EDD98_5668 [Streptomyces sp. PanSC19]|uniref:hypothetical protein n=1 Tax=Streptomyces sp. PanSC19 TaxID=1520455 RepID=UPI000F47EC4C|nr:hypothetical protein [Streptomyces sp. PanSC19]ROQ26076.1 hypothetical protein EDD98_5668 [Streptomyces sp. PanSC19]